MKRDREIDFKYNIKIYLELLKKHRTLALAVLFTVIVIQSSFILDKLLFKIIVDKGTTFLDGSLLTDQFVTVLLLVAASYATIVLLRSTLDWLQHHLLIKLDSSLIRDLKRKFFNHIIHLSYNFHTTRKTGQIISRLIRGGHAVERMTDTLVWNFAPLIVQMATIIVSLIYFEWISAVAVVAISIVFVSFSVFMQHIQKVANVKALKVEDFEKANIADIFANIDSIKHFGKEAYIRNRFAKLTADTKLFQVKHWNFFRWSSAGQKLIVGLGYILVLYYPVVSLLSGETTLGTVTFIFAAYGNITGSLFSFTHGIRNYYRLMADFESLFHYNKIENDIKDKKASPDLTVKKGTIEFKNVAFSYPKRKTLFKDFDLKIGKNQKVALVGRSGSGKSTLIRLLYRLYDVSTGSVLVDGKDIRDVKQESLRSELSIVPQECVLFDDTIYNNIAFSRSGASKEEVMTAIKSAQLEDLIARLPQKEKTIVGERGVKLSGGEKQRVSIARALLADKKILVLDEATSSMDSETEHRIQEALKKLMKGRTTIIIAHRLSTIMHADKIVVLENGEIVQTGKHSELIGRKGVYKKLWNLQKGGFIK